MVTDELKEKLDNFHTEIKDLQFVKEIDRQKGQVVLICEYVENGESYKSV